jgi:hypothetical protein
MNEPVTRQLLSGKLDGGANQLAHISLLDGKNNAYIGLSSGASRPLAGGNNTYIGAFSGANATADATVLVGTRAGRVGKSIREGIFIGYRAGEFAERVDSSVCIGPYAGQKMKRANNNCVVGYKAGAELTSGSRNTALGAYASFQQFNGTDNVCVGFRSGYMNRIGANNCYVGSNSGFSAVSGYENVCLGVGSGQFLTAGTKNVLCGFLAGNAISNASNCIAIGTRAMEFFDSGDTNTCLGTETARRLSGNNNTILGGYTASNAAGSFNTVVGSRSMNRTNNWKVDLTNSVIVGENVQFNLPVSVIGLTYENATAPVTTVSAGITVGSLDASQKVVAFDRQASDYFGQSIAVSADGNFIVVSTYIAPAGTGVGAAYVYVKSGNAWELQQKLPTQGVAGGYMGLSAAISADGSYIALGARNRSGSVASEGAVYIFVRTVSSWALQQRILAPVAVASDFFGWSVGLSGSGDTLITGAYGQDTDAAGGATVGNAGAAYLFTRTSTTWTFAQKIVPTVRGSSDQFGISCSISSDGTVALIGAQYQDTDAAGGASLASAGAAYIFTKASGVWTQTQKIVASDRTANNAFGSTVSLSGNGLYAIVGSALNATNASGGVTLSNAGAVYIFVREAGGSVWTQQAKVVASDRAIDNFFGLTVDISGDGRYALSSAYGNKTNATGGSTLTTAGAVYLLIRDGASWTSQRKLVASDRAAGDEFGRTAVSISDSGAVVGIGASQQDTNATGGATLSNAGAAYVYYTSGNVAQLVDATLDTGLVGTEDISYFMRNTLTSPTQATPSIGSAHRARIAFEVDTAPTLDTLAPYERYISFGFANDSTAAWTTNAKAKAGPMTVRVGTTGTSTPNPPNGIYRLRWNHNVDAFAYQDPSRYDLYVEPGPSVGLRAVTHAVDGELVPVNGALLAMSSASGDGRSLAAGGTIVTATTAAPHGLAVGTIISLGSIADPVITPGVTGVWEVTGVTTSTLTFTTMADGATTIALGTAKLYVCHRFVSTNAHTVFVRLQIDGRTAIAFAIPKPLDYGYLDFVVEQTNPTYGASVPELNLMVRHAPIPPGVSFVAQTVPPGYADVPSYITFTITGNIDDPLAPACRTLPGSPFPLDSTSIAVQGGIATFSSQAGLVDPETEADLYADWRANFPEGGAPYNSSAYSRWLNHRLIVCGGEIYISNSTTPYLNGTWKVKDIVGSTFTIDVSELKLADAQYPVGTTCLVYPARVFFNRVTDGLRFLADTDAEFIDRFGAVDAPNPRRVYMRASRGHDLAVGSVVFFDGAADARLNGCFDILECPALDPAWYDPDPAHPADYTGEGRDHWAVFDLDFDPDDAIEVLTGANIVQYAARLDPSTQYVTIDGFTNDVPGSVTPQMALRTANTVNMVTYASKSDLSLINVAVSGPTLGDGHVHLGFGSLSAMNANIGSGKLEFTDLGTSRAVYTIGDFNKTLAVSGTWGLSGSAGTSMTFGVDWLDEYSIACIKDGTALDFFATRISGIETKQVAQISHSAVVLYGNITGEAVPLQIADVMATDVPRLTLGFVHNFTARTLNINFLVEGGSIVDAIFVPTVSHATSIELRNVGETLYAPGKTIEFFSNAFTTLANLSISSTQIRESPVFANVVYLGSSHTVTAEEDRQDVLIASLGPNRLIRANVDTFRIYSSSLAVGNISFGNGASTFGSVAQITQAKTGAYGVVEHDYAISSVFYHDALSANFTCSVINVPTTNDRNSPLTLVLTQGSTPYMANALQINGLATTISWLNNAVPTGNASKTNLVTFAMLRAANAWTVLGKSEVFG